MTGERIHRSMPRTPEEKRRLQEIRERFQQERPGLDDLLASGDATEVVVQGEYLDLCTMLTALKRHRERQGLSLSDVAARSGMDLAAVSRLESGACLNPTLETLYRYAEAVRAEIGFTIHTS